MARVWVTLCVSGHGYAWVWVWVWDCHTYATPYPFPWCYGYVQICWYRTFSQVGNHLTLLIHSQHFNSGQQQQWLPPSLLMWMEGFFISFWVTTTMTPFWATTTTMAASLTANTSGGVLYLFLGGYNNNSDCRLSRCKCKWGGVSHSVLSNDRPGTTPPPSLQMWEGAFLLI